MKKPSAMETTPDHWKRKLHTVPIIHPLLITLKDLLEYFQHKSRVYSSIINRVCSSIKFEIPFLDLNDQTPFSSPPECEVDAFFYYV